jgi:hypothetical protein
VNNSCITIVAALYDYTIETLGDVVVTSDTGSVVAQAPAFRYIGRGSINFVNPNSGQFGILVALSGLNFLT